MAVAALAILVMLAIPAVHGADVVNGFTCNTAQTITLTPGDDLATYQVPNTTYILPEGEYTVSFVSNTAPLCYIGQGSVIVGALSPTSFRSGAPLALKGLTLDGQQTGGIAVDVTTGRASLYAEDAVIQGFMQGAVQVIAAGQAFLKNVQFLSNQASGDQGAAIYGGAGPQLVLVTVRVVTMML